MSRRFVFADAHAGGVPREQRQVFVLVEELPMHGLLRVHREDDDPARVANIPVEWLEEVKPPSIDDPAPWPLYTWDSETDCKVYVDRDDTGAGLAPRAAKLGVSLRAAHLKEDGSKGIFDYVRAEIPLAVHQMRELAQVLWQRANEIESGA